MIVLIFYCLCRGEYFCLFMSCWNSQNRAWIKHPLFFSQQNLFYKHKQQLGSRVRQEINFVGNKQHALTDKLLLYVATNAICISFDLHCVSVSASARKKIIKSIGLDE